MPAPDRRQAHARTPRWVAGLDGALDGCLLAFAAWTLAYEVALWARLSVWWPARVWLVLALVLVAGCAVRAVREGQPVAREGAGQPSVLPAAASHHAQDDGRAWRPLLVIVLVLVLAGLVAARHTVGLWPLAVVSIVILVGLMRRRSDQLGGLAIGLRAVATQVRGFEHAVAALACLGFGVLSAFILNSDSDDVFYVNRATWVAEHGIPALRDTMFGPGTYPSTYGGGLPLASIETLQGGLAHVLGLQAPTVAYLISVPFLAAAGGWATWRLLRAWAPRRVLLTFLGSLIFTLASGETIVGNYSIGRIWQGKVTAYVVLIPLIWLFLSRQLSSPGRWNLLLLLASGICFVGLSPTAALLGPLIAAAALLAALILRSRPLATGAVALLIGPVVAGLVVALGPNVGGVSPEAVNTARAFQMLFGVPLPTAVLGVVALVVGVWLVRGPVSLLVMSGALATVAVLVPGVFQVTNTLTGAGPIAWRLLLGIPLWVLVGLLFAAPWPGWLVWRPRVLSAGLLPVVLVLVILTSGTALWSSDIRARLTDRPVWKVSPSALADVRAAMRLKTPSGLWLLPQQQMEILAISTTDHFAVVPRSFYLPGFDAGTTDHHQRMALLDLVTGVPVTVSKVRKALIGLDVALACVGDDHLDERRVLRRAVAAPLQPVERMACHVGRIVGAAGSSAGTA